MEDEIFFNQSKCIKEMLKKFRLEDSKPTKTLMSTEIKLTKDDEADSVDNTKYRESALHFLQRVPFERRDKRPAQPRIVYLPILNINYFRHFFDILKNYNPIDDEPMWVADHVVALTPSFAITIPETANEFAIKGSSNSDTDKIMARMDAMTMKMDAHTQLNPKGSSSKPYQPPQARNQHVNAVFTQSGKSYDPPTNPNDQQNDSGNPINFDSEDDEEESTPQPKSQTSNQSKKL
ncbi:hypothetical protein Tco_1192636 [Tanacetum coccineum]